MAAAALRKTLEFIQRNLKVRGPLIFDHFLDAASNKTSSSRGKGNILELGIEALYFENQWFTETASTQCVRMHVFSIPAVGPQCHLVTPLNLATN